MTLPHVLLVDDSEAFLAFERAALAGHCVVSTAKSGVEALEKAAAVKPDAILLDLSMPEMDGDEVLAQLRATPELASVPVVIVSSELERGMACVKNGAAAFLPKPVRSEELRGVVDRVVEEARLRARADSVAVLPLGVGHLDLALPLEHVVAVVPQPATLPLPGGPFYLTRMFDFRGEAVAILDLAARFGVTHELPVVERKLVIVEVPPCTLALSVDRVRDPEEIGHGRMRTRLQLGLDDHRPLSELLLGVFPGPSGQVAVVDAKALLSQRALAELSSLVRAASVRVEAP
jgi:CheY-like chemotaxis protein